VNEMRVIESRFNECGFSFTAIAAVSYLIAEFVIVLVAAVIVVVAAGGGGVRVPHATARAAVEIDRLTEDRVEVGRLGRIDEFEVELLDLQFTIFELAVRLIQVGLVRLQVVSDVYDIVTLLRQASF